MYDIPDDLPLSEVIGEFTTQICVGLADLQFTFGKIIIMAWGEVDLLQNEELIAVWQGGKGLDNQFIEIINKIIVSYTIPNDQKIILYFENGIEMHLKDDSDYQFEWLQIRIEGTKDWWII